MQDQEIASEVVAAEKRIRSRIRETPLEPSPFLSGEAGDASVYLKLESHQITVLSETGMGIAGDGLQMAAVEPGTWYRRVKAQQDSAADAYFISCTAIRSAEVIEPLERDLERPVVTSNQAMVWHTLKTVGVREQRPGYGRLMAALGAA